MRAYDAAATAALLPYVPLSEEIAATLARKAKGQVAAPERLSLPLPGGGVLLVMPASDGEVAVTKLISVCPGNPARGLPLIQGQVAMVRAETGQPLGALDGPEVTARRTAAASLLAASLLAPNPRGPLLVVGAGVQALSHAMAFASGIEAGEVFVCSRARAKADALVARLRAAGVEARAVDRAEEVLDRTPLVVTATDSPQPVIPARVRPDAFIAAVGSFSPERAEIPAELVRRCRIFVDDLASARAEAGDLLLAGIDWAEAIPLENVSGRLEFEGPVLYKAVGHAALDLAAARLALRTILAG